LFPSLSSSELPLYESNRACVTMSFMAHGRATNCFMNTAEQLQQAFRELRRFKDRFKDRFMGRASSLPYEWTGITSVLPPSRRRREDRVAVAGVESTTNREWSAAMLLEFATVRIVGANNLQLQLVRPARSRDIMTI
jgi:hypothetical protein